ncbi:EamA family transporter [Rhodococcus sp. G-MC3]|uniref:EamA family transporter n=1 Tax=Rhodococcus sp. G-MC3 TaxID=3046209 RepID=UPI0024B948B0|nr:EamA family transporter [Rhodococcus sp. G-MC3]MDJ0391734.1 EamA family transporter [Rhodococcus sp. G-MC3]
MARGKAEAAGVDRMGSFPGASIPALFVAGGLCQYLGAAIGIFLFDILDPAAVAWLRALGAGMVLLLWRRPWVRRTDSRRWTGRKVMIATLFGLATVGMNVMFYEAIARIPLGAAVAIEFLGPVTVAAFGSRRPRDVCALVLVVAGVLAIAGSQFDGGSVGLPGVGFALASAALWAAYILLGKRVADSGDGIDDLAVGMAAGALLLSPLLLGPVLGADASVFLEPRVWILGLGVGLMSSVIPYVLDQIVLAKIGRARFALLLALLPTTATVVGAVVLTQLPTLAEAAGIVAVVGAVVLGGSGTRADAARSDGSDEIPPP